MKILYLCTHNRCRSILSEAITNQLAGGRLRACSAGSQPAGEIHPFTLKYLAENGIPTAGLRSKALDEFEADQPDIVVTVCDRAASEACPVWFGNAARLHWGLADPSAVQGSEADVRAAFLGAMHTIEQRVRQLLALDLENLGKAERQTLLNQLVRD